MRKMDAGAAVTRERAQSLQRSAGHDHGREQCPPRPQHIMKSLLPLAEDRESNSILLNQPRGEGCGEGTALTSEQTLESYLQVPKVSDPGGSDAMDHNNQCHCLDLISSGNISKKSQPSRAKVKAVVYAMNSRLVCDSRDPRDKKDSHFCCKCTFSAPLHHRKSLLLQRQSSKYDCYDAAPHNETTNNESSLVSRSEPMHTFIKTKESHLSATLVVPFANTKKEVSSIAKSSELIENTNSKSHPTVAPDKTNLTIKQELIYVMGNTYELNAYTDRDPASSSAISGELNENKKKKFSLLTDKNILNEITDRKPRSSASTCELNVMTDKQMSSVKTWDELNVIADREKSLGASTYYEVNAITDRNQSPVTSTDNLNVNTETEQKYILSTTEMNKSTDKEVSSSANTDELNVITSNLNGNTTRKEFINPPEPQCLKQTEVTGGRGGGSAILVFLFVVVSAVMSGSCDGLPTPPVPTTHHHTQAPPRRDLRLCCEGQISALSAVGDAAGGGGGVGAGALRPGNVRVVRRSPTSVLVTWSSPPVQPLKYEITYKPTNAKYRVVAEVSAPQRRVVLERLLPLTEYQVFVTSVHNSTALHTSPAVTFLTATHSTHDNVTGEVISTPTVSDGPSEGEEGGMGVSVDRAAAGGQVRVRAEEVGIVLLVLAVWMFAIALFFNRWGKIRMLEPYQEPYKESPPPQLLQHRPSCPMASDTPINPIKRGSLQYPQSEQHHGVRRKRQNSVFVDRTRSYSLEVHPPRRVKSALNLTTLVLQESEEEGATTATTTFT